MFTFYYKPYIAVIGDIIKSKEIEERKDVQNKLKLILDHINQNYEKDIASKFIITLGDECQGLLTNGAHCIEIIEEIEREIYPIQIRFGIGVGEITTDIDPDRSIGADGSAYHNARKMIDEIKAAEKKYMEPKINTKIKIEGNPDISDLINAVFYHNTILKLKWTNRQREIISNYLKYGSTQCDTAKNIGINQSNVQKALANSNFYTYQRALGIVAKNLSKIKGTNT